MIDLPKGAKREVDNPAYCDKLAYRRKMVQDGYRRLL